MTRVGILSIFGAAAFSLVLAAAPAQAQNNTVSYVDSFTGNDSNSCDTPGGACQSIDGALSKTDPGGEIRCVGNVRDTTVEVTKPITIDCDASTRHINGSASVAFTIDLNEATYPNGVVTLRNLNISGFLGSVSFGVGIDGIRVIGGGAAVHIENVTITGFAEQGIDFRPTSSVDLFVRNTIISNNQGGAVWVVPAAAATVKGSLADVSIDGNGGIGVYVAKSSGGSAVVTVEDSRIEKNQSGLRAYGALAYILLSGATIAHNSAGLQPVSGGKIVSSGNNTIHFNGTNGAPTSTVPLK
jgi:hypothetical protein